MVLEICRVCHYRIHGQTKAISCTNCGALLKMKEWRRYCFYGFFIIIILGVITNGFKLPVPNSECENAIAAFVMAQKFVEERLKAPSTAKFPYSSSEGVRIEYQGDCKYKVRAYVDAQNSFGAMIRTRYYAEVQNTKGTDKWRLLDISMY